MIENDIEILRETKTMRLVRIKFQEGYLYELYEVTETGKGMVYILTRSRNAAIKRFHYIRHLERMCRDE